MKIILISLLVFSATLFVKAQSEAVALVDKSIKYHDPKNNWEKLKVTFKSIRLLIEMGKLTVPKETFSLI